MENEINEVLYGDIEWPTEFDKLIIKEPKNAEEYVKSQTAWLAKASAYIAMHLKRWVEEKVVDKIYYWYKNVSSPFTKRMMPIIQPCEDLLNVLPARLPTFQQRFREKYEQMLSVAKKADEKLIYRLDKDINNFKLAAKDLHEIVMMIHSEALVAVKADLDEKPAETGRNTTPAKRWKFWTCVKRIPRWIYVLVLFLAAMLTCIYLSWWLWTTFWKK